jgi:hypothetical protein
VVDILDSPERLSVPGGLYRCCFDSKAKAEDNYKELESKK